jgi:hypothetical protein
LRVSGLDDDQRRRAATDIQTAAARIHALSGAMTAMFAPT